jgi:hypothetical protein
LGLVPQAKLLGEDRGKRASRIVVGADHGSDGAVPDLGADARDLGDWVGGAIQSLRPAADQLLEARARIIMEQIVKAGTAKPRELAMVAEG